MPQEGGSASVLVDRARVGISEARRPPGSVALLDWPSVRDFTDLIEGREVEDPFIALFNFSTVLSALLFYDGVVYIDFGGGGASERLEALLGRRSPFTPISLARPDFPQGFPHDDPVVKECHALIVTCIRDFDAAEHGRAEWLEQLERRWSTLFPGLNWPSHAFEPTVMTASRMFAQGLYPLMHAFARTEGTRHYDFAKAVDWPWTIVTNNVRTLFYSRLARTLTDGLEGEGTRVRYVGGALRTPMLVTLAELAERQMEPEEAARVEGWLEQAWRDLRPTEKFAVRMPFWFEAVIGRAGTRAKLPEVIVEFRKQATRFRRRRSELEAALARRDEESISKLAAGLRGDAAKLTEGVTALKGAATAAAEVGLRAFLPLPVRGGEALSLLSAAVGPGRGRSVAIRLFHPEVRALYNLGRHAARLGNSLPAAFDLFGLPKGDATKPTRFLNKMGEVSALA